MQQLGQGFNHLVRLGSFLTNSARTCIRLLVTDFSRRRPYRDSYDYTNLLQRCTNTKSVKTIHAQILTSGLEQNPFVITKLIAAYIDCNVTADQNMDYARKVFDKMRERDIFLWNVIIQGYANSGPFEEALNIYDELRLNGVVPNRYTFTFVLKACGAWKNLFRGESVLAYIVKLGFDRDLFVGNALLALYSKCGEVGMSRRLFNELPGKDIVSWNSMISGYVVNDFADEALQLFVILLHDRNVKPDRATFVGILPACAQAAAIQVGIWIHGYIVKTGMELDAALGSGLISTYANCGHVNIARDIFDGVLDKNIVVWNAIIRCYGMHGHADEALYMFSRFLEVGLKPDGVLFLCILSTCSHAGLLKEGLEIFKKMADCGIEELEEHYACVIDLLGRAGLLNEVVKLIETMPITPGKDVYGALLGACRIHNNMELAEMAAEKLFQLDPENAGRYIILAKMYEDTGQWEDAARLRKGMKEKSIRKPIGCSAVEIESTHYTFGVEDESHPFAEQIFETLNSLKGIMDEHLKSFEETALPAN